MATPNLAEIPSDLLADFSNRQLPASRHCPVRQGKVA